MKKITVFAFFISMAMILLFLPVKVVKASETAVISDVATSTVDSFRVYIQRLPTSPDDEKEDEEDNGEDGEDDSDGFDRLWDVSSLG